jgi:DNA-binding response OmpR family regulator
MSQQPAKILVLNDSPEMLNLVRDILTEAGYTVETGLKPLTTVDELIAIAPDLLILDFLWSEDRRGWEFLKLVRGDPRTSTLPVILCTTGGPVLDALAQDIAAMDITVLLKPFEIETLVGSVHGHCGEAADRS